MNFIDFVYYIAYKAYLRGNKSEAGSFFINSLWISLFQYMLLFIVMTTIELSISTKIFLLFENIVNFAAIILLIVIINNVYLTVGNRKEKILNRVQYPLDVQKKYWIFFTVIFFIVFITGGIMAIFRKKYLG